MASPVFSLTESSADPPRESTILITGGASGIGLETAKFLHETSLKNNVVVLDRDLVPPESVEELRKSSRFLYISADVTDWIAQRNAFSQAATFFGRIDHVFVNAGVLEVGDQIWSDERDESGQLLEPVRTTIDVDIRAVGDTLKLAMFHLRLDRHPDTGKPRGSGRGRGGTIVMTASLAGYVATTGAPLYSAAKHGVLGYMRALKSQARVAGIAISVVAPGITVTPMLQGTLPQGETLETQAKAMLASGIALNQPRTIAYLVGHIQGLGAKANGHGYLVQNDRIRELEGALAKTREQWMGTEMLALFRSGRAGAGASFGREKL